MASTATVNLVTTITGDTQITHVAVIAANLNSPAWEQLINLAMGNNTITVPVGGTSVTTGCVIQPPIGNASVILLKSVAGDAGISIHPTDGMRLSLAASVVTFVLNAAAGINGVRLVWS